MKNTVPIHTKKQTQAYDKRRKQSEEIYAAIKDCQHQCCKLDRQQQVIRTSCSKERLQCCMEKVRQKFELHSIGLYGDELIFMKKEPKATPLGKLRKEQLKDVPEPCQRQKTYQKWNSEFNCWETAIEE